LAWCGTGGYSSVITFLCGIGHVVAIIGIGVASALIVGKVAKGQEFTTTLIILMGADSVVGRPALSGILAGPDPWPTVYSPSCACMLYQLLDRLAPAYLFPPTFGRPHQPGHPPIVETHRVLFSQRPYHGGAPGFVAIMVPGTVPAVLAYFAWPLALVLLPFLLAVGSAHLFASRVQERLGREFRRPAWRRQCTNGR